MYDFLFELNEYSENEGERIFVECESLTEAKVILEMNDFRVTELSYLGRFTPEEAEILGYDTY